MRPSVSFRQPINFVFEYAIASLSIMSAQLAQSHIPFAKLFRALVVWVGSYRGPPGAAAEM
jgi:hypothetical protein